MPALQAFTNVTGHLRLARNKRNVSCCARTMNEEQTPAGARINRDDEGEVARWAERLCTSPSELRDAISAVGPDVEQVKRYLFTMLIKRNARR
jgi:Protein of unknown function (DUF3606)